MNPRASKDILAKNPDIVGFYSVSENYKFVVDMFRRIKEKRPDIITILGGPHVYGLPHASIKPDCIDLGVNGEAELAILKLVETNFDKSRFKDVPGLIYKEGTEVKVNALALIHNLDEIPFPARRLYPPMDRYRPSIISYKRLPATGMLTSRGCNSRCTFCHSGKGEFGLRFHSPEYVIEEIKHLYKDFGVREFFIFDDTFVANKARAMKICEEIIKAALT